MKINSGIGTLGLIIVLAILGVAGYFLYGRYQIKMEISRIQEKIEQANRELNEAQAGLVAETDKQTQTQNLLAEMPKKKEELSLAQKALNNELKKLQQDHLFKLQSGVKGSPKNSAGLDSPGEMQKEIAALNGTIAAAEAEIKKLDCHYNCMGTEKFKDPRKSSDNGEWDRFARPPVWTCKTHHYSFTDNLQYLDHRYETSKCTNRIKDSQKKIAEITNDIEKAQSDQIEKEKAAASADEINAKLTQLEDRQKSIGNEAIRLNNLTVETEKSIAACKKRIVDINNEIKSLNNKLSELRRGK